MADIKISGRTKVKSFYNSFIKEFPYLHASLRYPNGKGVDINASVANARAKSLGGEYSPTGNAELSIRGNLNVGTFEKRFKKEFSITCEIHFMRENGRWAKTGKQYDAMTLNEASAKLKDVGARKIEKF
tara:strand:- start:567 stop:953 length:387 start_codon:yes stop_codon:yes gene_type:complete